MSDSADQNAATAGAGRPRSLLRSFAAGVWDGLARQDAMHAVLTTNDEKSFWESGRQEIGALVRAGLVDPRARVLDYGAGLGRLSIALAHHARSVVSADVSLEMLSRLAGNARNVPNLSTLHIVPGRHLGGPYDLIVSFLVLQHMPPYLARCTLRMFADSLVENGRVAIDLPVIEWETKETAVYWPRVPVRELWTSRYYHSWELDRFLFHPAGLELDRVVDEVRWDRKLIVLRRSPASKAARLGARAVAAAHEVAGMSSDASGVTQVKRARRILRWTQHVAWTALLARIGSPVTDAPVR